LKVCESIPLGDKRFLAIVQVDQREFLVGGSNQSLVMLAQVSDMPPFAQAMRQELSKETLA
jgi:flagellar biogenesis protein FliO